MTGLATDPLMNIVYRGIKEPIRLLLENSYPEAALKLLYSGIDTMAFLDMPPAQRDVHEVDFTAWCDHYLRFPGDEPVTSLELYAARCGLLHSHSGDSRKHREGRARLLQYTDKGQPVRYRPDIDPDLVIISIQALADAFFEAVDRFLVDLFHDPSRAQVANSRLQDMFVFSAIRDLDPAP